MPFQVHSGLGTPSSQFWYGPDRQRFKQLASYSGGTETTHYVGGVLEKLVTAGNTQYKHFIAGPSGLVAIYTRRVNANPTLEDTFYFTRDHQGNVDSITKANGQIQVRLSYDAFGKRRNEVGWSGPVPGADWTAIANSSRRGYTEHEHLDNLGLIHMNGRVQDPLIGRFLSADPYVPDPWDGQSFNRYSYVRNNPLSRVDPTGFCDAVRPCRPTLGGPSWGIAPNLWGTGAFTYTASVLAAYMDTPGQGRDAIAGELTVVQFEVLTKQAYRAIQDSTDTTGVDQLRSPQDRKGFVDAIAKLLREARIIDFTPTYLDLWLVQVKSDEYKSCPGEDSYCGEDAPRIGATTNEVTGHVTVYRQATVRWTGLRHIADPSTRIPEDFTMEERLQSLDEQIVFILGHEGGHRYFLRHGPPQGAQDLEPYADWFGWRAVLEYRRLLGDPQN